MKKLMIIISLCSLLSANINHKKPEIPVNKIQLCSMYEGSFITSADVYEDTKSCYDLKYSILSFKQMILAECDIDPEYIKVIWYLQKTYEKNCGAE